MSPTASDLRDATKMASRGLSVLVLCDDAAGHADTLLDHIRAFQLWSRHRVRLFNPRNLPSSWFLELAEFDVVIVHYSLSILVDSYLAPAFRQKIRDFRGLKVLFVQDDYRWVNRMASMIDRLGFQLLYTLAPQDRIRQLWRHDSLQSLDIQTTLAGYVPDRLVGLSTPDYSDRPIDIGYRGRTVPFWLGDLGQDKIRIGRGVAARAGAHLLRIDIASDEASRMYGDSWAAFMLSCKACLGTESGASIADFDDTVEQSVREYLLRRPDAAFEDVAYDVLRPFEGNVPTNVISPRVFEAAAYHTAMILFPGEYCHVIEPWRHYIPLEKDFSNFDDVVRRLQDASFIRDLTMRAYDDLIASGRYSARTFVAEVDNRIAHHYERLQSAGSSLTQRRGFARRCLIGWRLAKAEQKLESPVRAQLCRVRRLLSRVTNLAMPGVRIAKSVARSTKRLVVAAMEGKRLRAIVRSDRRRAVAALNRSSAAWWNRVVRCQDRLKRLLISTQIVRSHADFRDIFRQTLFSRRRRSLCGIRQLTSELLRLAMIERASSARSPELGFEIVADFCPRNGVLLFRSVGSDHNTDRRAGDRSHPTYGRHNLPYPQSDAGLPLTRLIWDHSAVRTPIVCQIDGASSIHVSLDPDHRFEFAGLAALYAWELQRGGSAPVVTYVNAQAIRLAAAQANVAVEARHTSRWPHAQAVATT